MTRKFAVLGSPIAHSKSPYIHDYFFKESGFDASYERFEVGSDLAGFIENKPDFSGFSLTMPLKEQAFRLATERDESAQATGAVNTLLRVANGWSGFNTDVAGIRNAIGFHPSLLAVIGSGATAHSALQAFPESKKLIFARSRDKASELAAKYDAEVTDLQEAFRAEVVISTVTEGALPDLLAGKTIEGVLLDCVYTNPVLPAGRYVSGLVMLVHQAMIQQRIFQFGDPNHPLNREPDLISEVLRGLGMAK